MAGVGGEGLLVGLRAVVPSADLVDELRAEKMITVAAGDNVVRLLPPLIIGEDEIADVMTFEEHRGAIQGKTVAWTGDANNVLVSWMHAAERFDFRMRVATPPELAPKKWLRDWVKGSHAAIDIGSDPEEAVKGCDCVVTATWVSMGDKDRQRRHNVLKRYQVNARLMALANPRAVFMHCLPAHRGQEVTDEVIDGPQSIVFDEAENRLHAHKGILAWCLNAGGT